MKRPLMKVTKGDSHMSENLKTPYPEATSARFERRWRRREAMNNSVKHNRYSSVKKTTAKVCGNGAVLTNKNDHTTYYDTDEDYRIFLGTYAGNNDEVDDDDEPFLATNNPDIEIDSASNHNGGSDNGVDVGSEEIDEDYVSFLVTYNPDIEIDSAAGDHIGGSNIGGEFSKNNDSEETDEDYRSFLVPYNPDIEIDYDHNDGSNINVNFGNNNDSEEIEEDYNYSLNQSDSDYISDGVDVDADDQRVVNLVGENSSVRQNSLVSDEAFDKDYELFLNSVTIVDDDNDYICDKNTTNTSKVDEGSNSSDSDVVVLEPDSIGVNTPFVLSKTYDSSCFGGEMKLGDNMQIVAFDDSIFRRELLEELDRPYDEKEYYSLLEEVLKEKKKERHLETRQGVLRYKCRGFTESFLQIYPDLGKALTECKAEKCKMLFIMRGFFFWLKNLPNGGVFKPWLDEACLERLKNM